MIHGPMTLLMRSVRADALKRSAHLLRIGSVLLIFCFLLAAHLKSSFSTSSAPGLQFFQSIAYLGLALTTLAGVGHFSHSITEEKEEGTLGLLLLANISPLGILLGKSTSKILTVLLLFAAQFPFALLAITLGGISVAQIVAIFVALGSYLFLIANVALLTSVWAKRSSQAASGMVLFLILLFGLAPAFSATVGRLKPSIISFMPWIQPVSDQLDQLHQSVSVIKQFDLIFEGNARFSILSWQCWSSLLLGGCAFLLAWESFRRFVWAPDVDKPQRLLFRSPTRRWSPLVGRVWRLANAWKDYHFLTGGHLSFVLKIVVYAMAAWCCLHFRQEIRKGLDVDGVLMFRNVMLVILSLEVLILSGQFFQFERISGTLPTLLMLPYTVGRISYSKLSGCFISLIPTVAALLVAEELIKIHVPIERFVSTKYMFQLTCALLVLGHLTVLCSLIVNRGSLPLAMGLSLIFGMLFAPFVTIAMTLIRSANQGPYAEYSPLLYATGVLCAAAQFEIARRTEKLAGS